MKRPQDFTRILLSQRPQRLEPAAWLRPWARRGRRRGCRCARPAWPSVHARCGDLQGAADLLQPRQLHLQVPPESIHLEEPIMWESVVAYVDFEGGSSAVRFQPIAMNKIGKGLPNPHDMHDVQPVPADSRSPEAGYWRSGTLPFRAARRVLRAFRHQVGDARRHGRDQVAECAVGHRLMQFIDRLRDGDAAQRGSSAS